MSFLHFSLFTVNGGFFFVLVFLLQMMTYFLHTSLASVNNNFFLYFSLSALPVDIGGDCSSDMPGINSCYHQDGVLAQGEGSDRSKHSIHL